MHFTTLKEAGVIPGKHSDTRVKTCLLLSLIALRVVIVNSILETHGLPAFARGMPVLLLK
jgi:hypothetical protein